jgi:hypothetical protein
MGDKPLRRTHYYWACLKGINETLQAKPGVYMRHQHGDPANVSADQLVSACAAHVAEGNTKQVLLLAARCIARLGFAQNYKDGLDASKTRWKLPDFMALRALPLFMRAHVLLYPAAVIADVLLLLLSISAVGPVWRDDTGFSKRGPDDCDHNVSVLTLAVCRHRMPTPLSWLACKIFAKYCPETYGTIKLGEPNRVQGALAWYHRAESGGNPEIAEMWKPICRRYFE